MIETRAATVTDIRQGKGGATAAGYALKWNHLSVNLGGFKERFRPGAFAESLRDHPDVIALHHHDGARVLGRVSSGTLKVWEDERGLAFTLDLPDTAQGHELRTLIGRRDVRGMSFGFGLASADDEEFSGYKAGSIIRTIHRARLFEISTTAWPAYPTTVVDVDAVRAAKVRMARVLALRGYGVHAAKMRMARKLAQRGHSTR